MTANLPLQIGRSRILNTNGAIGRCVRHKRSPFEGPSARYYATNLDSRWLGSGLIKSTIPARRRGKQRRGSFSPVCRIALRCVWSPWACWRRLRCASEACRDVCWSWRAAFCCGDWEWPAWSHAHSTLRATRRCRRPCRRAYALMALLCE